MSGLAWVNEIAFYIHIFSIVGLMVLLLMQVRKSPRRIHPGTLHTALTALAAGLLMVGIRTPLNHQDPEKWPLLNNAVIGLKFAILLVILVLISQNFKKPRVKNSIWIVLIALTTSNILIALVR